MKTLKGIMNGFTKWIGNRAMSQATTRNGWPYCGALMSYEPKRPAIIPDSTAKNEDKKER